MRVLHSGVLCNARHRHHNCHVTLVLALLLLLPSLLSYQDVTLHHKYPATTPNHPTQPNTEIHYWSVTSLRDNKARCMKNVLTSIYFLL